MSDDFEALQEIAIDVKQEIPKKENTKTSLSDVFELLKKQTQEKIETYKQKIITLQKQIQEKDLQIKDLLSKQNELSSEIENLKQQISIYEEEKAKLLEEKKVLEDTINQLKDSLNQENAYKQGVLDSLKQIEAIMIQRKQLALDELEDLVYTILDSLFMKCNVDISSIIKQILVDAKIFKEFIILKANKNFIETFKKYIDSINDIDIEFIEQDFKDGEFQIETKDFILERLNKDILKDVVEKALQNLR